MTDNTRPSPDASVADSLRILRERAVALAKPAVSPLAGHNVLEVLEFRLANERYAIETSFVHEVVALKGLTPLPCTPAFIKGIANVRGRILPVIDIKKLFNLPDVGITDLHRIILVSGHSMELGILADSVIGVRDVAVDSLQHGMSTLSGTRNDYLKGLTAQGLTLLAMDHILSDPGLVVDEEVES